MTTNKFKKALLFIAVVMFCFSAFTQTPQQREQLRNLSTELNQIYIQEKAEVVRVADSLGIPLRQEFDKAGLIELQRFVDGRPVYYITHNHEGAQVIKSSEVWEGGSAGFSLSGEGQTLGIWDAGAVRLTHQEFQGRVVQADDAEHTHYHAVHVAGTMIAGGVESAAKGMSYKANMDAYDWNNDNAEMANAASEGLKVSQHSYGSITGWYWDDVDWYWFGDPSISETEDYRFGFYNDMAQLWDQIANNAPHYLITKSAGNDRGNGPEPGTGHYFWDDGSWSWSTATRDLDGGDDGYNCISTNGNAKNIMTVGAVTAAGDMSWFSAWGPTDDGRIKPDIVAKGVSVYSSMDDSDDSYASLNGTSMSGPMISGSVGLLLEQQENLHGEENPMLSSTMKALILHTAQEMGGHPGPDYRHGWGMMDTDRAAEVMIQDASEGGQFNVRELILNDGQTKEITVVPDGSEPLKATIAWNDPAGTPTAPALNPTDLMLVNDLDMRIDYNATTYEPWILDPANPSTDATTGDNFRDNIEQILVEDPIAGETYTITITHKNNLAGESQDFSLIVTGITSEVLELYNLTLEANPEEGGSVNGAGNYEEGEQVSVTATANSGYEFVEWIGDTDYIDNPEAASAVVSMPNYDVTLTANFIDDEVIRATIKPDYFEFEDFSDLDYMITTITWNDATDVERVYIIDGEDEENLGFEIEDNDGNTAKLIIDPGVVKQHIKNKDESISYDGFIELNIGSDAHFTVTFTNPKWFVDIWVYDESTGSSIEGAVVHILETGDTDQTDDSGEAFFKLAAGTYNVDITAEGYAKVENHQITVETGHDAVNDFDIGMSPLYKLTLIANPEAGGTLEGAGKYIEDKEITITATANDGFEFVNWTGDTDYIDDATAESAKVTMPDYDVTLTANFDKTADYILKLEANPEDGGVLTGTGAYNEGDMVEVTATANTGFEFIDWTDEADVVINTSESFDYTMPANDVTLTANFELIDYDITIEIYPQDAGSVTGHEVSYNFGNQVTLEATANTGFEFLNWRKDDIYLTSDNPYTFTMPAENINLTARFIEEGTEAYSVTLEVNDENFGKVAGEGVYAEGESVTAIATPFADHIFVNWTDEGDDIVSTDASYTFDMPGENITLTANFEEEEEEPTYNLTLNVNPSGAGTVSGSGSYTAGQSVSVSATANTGFEFENWTIDGSVLSGQANFNYTMPGNNVTLTANFKDVTLVEDISDTNISIFPNPTRSKFTVESDEVIKQIRLIDINGQVIKDKVVDELSYEMSVDNLHPGMYFMQIHTQSGVVTERVQIAR